MATAGDPCSYCPPPSDSNLTMIELKTLSDSDRYVWVKGGAGADQNCPLDPTAGDPPATYAQVCWYTSTTMGVHPDCEKPNTQTCTPDKPACNNQIGCIASKDGSPTSCKIDGLDASFKQCTVDTQCNSQGGPCKDYHCETVSGYAFDPGFNENATCKYTTTLPKIRPESELTICLTCSDGSSWNNDNTNPKCISDPPASTEVAPEKSVVCDVGKQSCAQGHGCFGEAGGGIIEYIPYPTPPPVCDQVGKQYICKTALGNIQTSAEGFVQAIMGLILSLVGGIAVLLIIISGYRLMVSQGNPENIKNAKDQLTAAIIGLLFVIFSLVILEIIGVNILGLPGFNP